MAVTFTGATSQGILVDSSWHSQAPQPLLIVVRTATDATQNQGRIFTGDSGVNNTYSLFAARTNPGGPLGYRVVRARTSGGPHRLALLSTAEYDGTYRTIAFQIASTPGGSHFGYVDGVSSTINQDNNTGTYATASPATTSCIGNEPDFTGTSPGPNPYDGGIEYLLIWQNTLGTTDQVRALSAGVHWSLVGLPAPTFGAEFFGRTDIFTGQSVNLNVNGGYETGAGAYTVYPQISQTLPTPVTPTPPSEDTNYTQQLTQPLTGSIGLCLGV